MTVVEPNTRTKTFLLCVAAS